MSPTPAEPRGVLHRLTHIGVDPALPRRETKHVVLTNAYALFLLLVCLTACLLSRINLLRPDVTLVIASGGVGALITLALNARRRPMVAATTLLIFNTCVFGYVGTHEPSVTEHEAVMTMNAVVAFYLYPPSARRAWSVWTAVTVVIIVAMRLYLRDHTPEQLPGYDAYAIGTSNVLLVALTLAFFSNRAANEIDSVERELIEEKKKTETLLKREVAHQVAERSRELGSALERGAGSAPSPTRFGSRYRVVRPLGEGGMGAVVEVERLTDGARLALKVMTGATSREQATRFAREAEIGARIQHENLVAIVDIGVADGGAPFLVMELAPGGSIEGLRARFGDAAWALSILRQMCAGLVALHAAGVVHRDLKPANVLLDAAGNAKLADFGIARMGTIAMGAVDPDAPTASPERGSALTGTGAWIGTPLYMAPEAAGGARAVSPAVDVFALGLVAHEMITGRLPFTTPPVLLSLVGQPLPACEPIATLPPRVRDALHACLSESPSARPTAAALVDALT